MQSPKIIDPLTYPVSYQTTFTKRSSWPTPFAGYQDRCPYCESAVEEVFHLYDELDFVRESWEWGGFSCAACDWWWQFDVSWNASASAPLVRVGSLYDFPEPPASLLDGVAELNRGSQSLLTMTASRLEEFVARTLKEFFACDVLHTGKSHDGGIDLVLLDADAGKVGVQVKRRADPHKKEPVSLVRELRGALLMKGVNRGIFVTTGCFSTVARKAAGELTSSGVTQRVELVDGRRILEILDLLRSRKSARPTGQDRFAKGSWMSHSIENQMNSCIAQWRENRRES